MSVVTHLLQRAHRLTLRSDWQRFERASRDASSAQERRLGAILGSVAASDLGCSFGLRPEMSPAQFRRAVDVQTHDTLREFIDAAAGGRQGAVSIEPTVMMERTSGSTSANKLIPFTRGMLGEVRAATNAWLFDLYRSYPALAGTRSYWSISPAAREREATEGGEPIGMESDTEYFGTFGQWALERLLAVPREVARAPDMAAWRTQTCRALMESRDLGLISVWSPTFMTQLMEAISEIAGKTLQAHDLWPRLALLSCWTDGESSRFVRDLRKFFPETPIQSKGLLATEGVVTIPIEDAGGAVAVPNAHVLEFVDVDNQDVRWLHELEVGRIYSPLLTTSGGLLRYHLPDALECTGHWRELPRLRFLHRLDRTSDLCGEKLHPHHIEALVVRTTERVGVETDFVLLAPHADPAHYCLFVETPQLDRVEVLSAAMEEALCESAHYKYCRELGQLGAIEGVAVTGGWDSYMGALLAGGQRFGDIKPSVLDCRPRWSNVFTQQKLR